MEECLIWQAPLEYLAQDEAMECAVCHKKEPSKTRCVNGHYVCSDCHTQGMDSMEEVYQMPGDTITVNTETAEALGADYSMFEGMAENLVTVTTTLD